MANWLYITSGRLTFRRHAILPASPSLPATVFRTSVMHLSNIGTDFEKALQRVKFVRNVSPKHQLKLYAFFKQATVGPCKADKPSNFDVVNLAKWNAWSSLGTMNSVSVEIYHPAHAYPEIFSTMQFIIKKHFFEDEAKRNYIEFVKSLVGEPLSNDANLLNDNVVCENSTSQAEAVPEKEEYSSSRKVLLEDKGRIFRIQLNRPEKKNALTHEMYRDIIDGLKAAEKSEAFITVLEGKGDYFCSGNDLNNLLVKPSDTAKMAADAKLLLRDFVGTFIDHPKVLVAAVNGPAVGISVTILGLFDLVFASDNATFHTPFTSLGQSPEGCSSFTFPLLMGNTKAFEMLLFNRKITAQEAKRRNIVTEVFQQDTFEEQVNKRIEQLSALPPQGLLISKKVLRQWTRAELHDANAVECEVLVGRWQSDECTESVMNFFKKRS
ncbi:Enoyl-CoA delta isomerase 2, mitochondrial [Trichinella patagoniensis]|uniref:Enoyl-CoA delta isomerase 2, mitochondrial n=1 Tax=Trichinella patagoniensis TaxID=990121 RepID=A0A0V0ZDA2_9BILA|nr:Enoyl-CoA delta isomerase 2, mitochondrial [Trichinella patagoniensis]